jgi:hypothetical protein
VGSPPSRCGPTHITSGTQHRGQPDVYQRSIVEVLIASIMKHYRGRLRCPAFFVCTRSCNARRHSVKTQECGPVFRSEPPAQCTCPPPPPPPLYYLLTPVMPTFCGGSCRCIKLRLDTRGGYARRVFPLFQGCREAWVWARAPAWWALALR